MALWRIMLGRLQLVEELMTASLRVGSLRNWLWDGDLPAGGSMRILSGATLERSEGSKIGQKLSYDAVTAKTWDNPTGSSGTGVAFQSYFESRKEDWVFVHSHKLVTGCELHWGGSITLGKAAPFAWGQCPERNLPVALNSQYWLSAAGGRNTSVLMRGRGAFRVLHHRIHYFAW